MRKLKTLNEWIDIMENHWAGLEQACYQSIKEKTCIDCFSKKELVLKNKRALIKSTDYYLCKECDEWWENKK